MIRVFVPESLAASFLAFIDQKSRENHPQIKHGIEKPSCMRDENYLIRLNSTCSEHYFSFLNAGMSKGSAISATLKKIKVLGFYNISYDNLKSVLTKNGCFKVKTA